MAEFLQFKYVRDLGIVHHLRFDWKWILTTPLPPVPILHHHIKSQHNLAMNGYIIDNLANFHHLILKTPQKHQMDLGGVWVELYEIW